MKEIRRMFRSSIAIFGVACLIYSSSSTAVDLPEPALDSYFYFDGAPSHELVDLGQNLFFDKIMSGMYTGKVTY